MNQVLRRIFPSEAAPSSSPREARQRRTLHMMLLASIVTCLTMIFTMVLLDLNQVTYTGRTYLYGTFFFFFVVTLVIVLIERFISTPAASLLFTILISVGTLLGDSPREFLEGQSIMFLIVPVLLAGLLLRPWAGYVVAGLLDMGEIAGFFVYHTQIPNLAAMVMLFVLAWVIDYSTSTLERAVEEEQKKSNALAESKRAISSQNQQIQEISRKLLEVQEHEKHILAGELHDDLGQSLTSLKLSLELTNRTRTSSSRQKRLAEARGLVTELMNKVRNLSLELRPAMLDDFGLFAALDWLYERFGSQAGISIECIYDVDRNRRFEPQVETAAFRIIQEALTNIARHASVTEAQVTVTCNDCLSIEVFDRGAGFDLAEAIQNAAHTAGLSGMQERARLLGGSVKIVSAPGAGTRVLAQIPLTGSA